LEAKKVTARVFTCKIIPEADHRVGNKFGREVEKGQRKQFLHFLKAFLMIIEGESMLWNRTA
jgi:hypothetical protein